MGEKRPHTYNVRAWLLTIAAVVLVAGGAWLLGPSIQSDIRAAMTPKLQPFTELYFSQHLALPKSLETARQYAVPFTLVNHEGTVREYEYKLTVTEGDKVTHNQTYTATLANRERRILSAEFTPTTSDQPVTITVTLLHNNQTIQFKATT